MSFDVWSADDPKWLELWSSWPEREPHAHPQYAALFEDEHTRALCAAWRSDDGCVLYPFLLRDLGHDPFNVHASDIVTPYGYGGPFFVPPMYIDVQLHMSALQDSRSAAASRFWPAFDAWASNERVVSELVRFSLFEDELLPYPGDREERLVNVVRDLDASADTLWMDAEHKVRKNVKKARRAGVRVEFDPGGVRLDEFLRLYLHTLERRDAPARYRFDRGFFERLPRPHLYVHALHDERVVSSELVLLSGRSGYSFLGGTDSDAFDLRPNDLLKWELILHLKQEGKRRFVLGGGYRADDGIFRYKRSFAPNGLVPFHIGRRILQQELYRELAARAGTTESDFFPAYRAPSP